MEVSKFGKRGLVVIEGGLSFLRLYERFLVTVLGATLVEYEEYQDGPGVLP